MGWHATPEGWFIVREGHVQALKRTREHLALAVDVAIQTPPALNPLREIFSRFCIESSDAGFDLRCTKALVTQ